MGGGKQPQVVGRVAAVAIVLMVICAGSSQVAAQCAVDEYDSAGTCTACAHTSATCTADGFALTATCGTGETTDVSMCTDCASMGMFVAAGGASCTGNCSVAGEVVIPGPAGDTTCGCPVDMYSDSGSCVACAHTSASCGDNGFALVACGLGETTDVSTCTNCTASGMFCGC